MDVNSVSPEIIYVGVVFMALGAIISVIRNAAGIWDIYRRKPAIDETLRKDFLCRNDFELHEARNDREFAKLQEDIRAMRSYNAKTTREIFEEIRKLNTTVNKEFQDFNKSIGRIEGEIKTVTAITKDVNEQANAIGKLQGEIEVLKKNQ